MPQTTDSPDVELARLAELHARWENLPLATGHGVADMVAKQDAYAAYRSRQAAYNARSEKAFDPSPVRHSPVRLVAWLRDMRDLFARAVDDPRCPCPVHLLEKAHRAAGRVAERLKAEAPTAAVPGTVRAAVEALEALAGWCDRAAG